MAEWIATIIEYLYFIRNKKTITRGILTLICTLIISGLIAFVITIVQVIFVKTTTQKHSFELVFLLILLSQIINEEYTGEGKIAYELLKIHYVLKAEYERVKDSLVKYVVQAVLVIVIICRMLTCCDAIINQLLGDYIEKFEGENAVFLYKMLLLGLMIVLYLLVVEMIIVKRRYYFIKTIVLIVLICTYLSYTDEQIDYSLTNSMSDVVIWAVGIIALLDLWITSVKEYMGKLFTFYSKEIEILLSEVDKKFYKEERKLVGAATEAKNDFCILQNKWENLCVKTRIKIIVLLVICIGIILLLQIGL